MQYDELYKALADEHRREIVSALCAEPAVAGDLARRVGLAPNALSFHLKWLRSAGLIGMQRRGRHLWYHLNGPALDRWREHVNAAFRFGPGGQAAHPARVPRMQPAQETTPVDSDAILPAELL